MRLLDEIVASTRRENLALAKVPIGQRGSPPIDVLRALRRQSGDSLRLIAEIKRKSPSAGLLSTTMSLSERAKCYVRAGATMLSILVDAPYFGGSMDDLATGRSAAPQCPVLCKGFIMDRVQIAHAHAAGADAILLIVRILEGERLKELHAYALSLGLCPIVEVTTDVELDRAVAVGASVIGVNARNLDTLVMDEVRAHQILSEIPTDKVRLYFSGLSQPEQVRRLSAMNACSPTGGGSMNSPASGRCTPDIVPTCDGALLGEALMRQDDPTALLTSLVAAACER